MDFTDKAAHTALTKILPEFTNSNISPENLADKLQARGIIGKAAYEAALNKLKLDSDRRRGLLNDVMGCGKNGAFQDLVVILLEMCEWFGKKLIAAYVKEGGVDIWTKKAHHTHVSDGSMHATSAEKGAEGKKSEKGMKEPKLVELTDNVKTTEWYNLGLHLGNDEADMNFITTTNPKEALKETFQTWRRTCAHPTWHAVVAALQEITENNLAGKIEKKFC